MRTPEGFTGEPWNSNHAHPGFASARYQGRSRFIEDTEEEEEPGGGSVTVNKEYSLISRFPLHQHNDS
jgi:hypothetical protein